MTAIVPLRPGRQPKIVSPGEVQRQEFRQYSGLVAEQVVGWSALLGGGVGLVFPHIAPATVAANPVVFVTIGAGVLSGQKLVAILKAALGALS